MILTLQQLTHMKRLTSGMFTTAMTLRPDGVPIKQCETDFVIVSEMARTEKVEIVIGECKTRQPITADDVRNLTTIADAFPKDRFNVYIAFSKLTDFTPDEIEIIKSANQPRHNRLILLTDRELEPYILYDRTALEFDIPRTAFNFEQMATVSRRVFFEQATRPI